MKRKFLKTSISILLALLFIVTPDSTAYIKADSVYAQTLEAAQYSALASQTAATSSDTSVQTSSEVDYTPAAQVAKLKAAFLTSTSYGATSVQYALIDNGEIVLSGQAGNYDKDKTVTLTNNHMYGIGSVSKVFTAAAIMQLVDQGKLALDKPVVKYMPEFKMADSRYKDITVRMLINHSSGLMGSCYHNSTFFGDITVDYNLLDALKTQRLKADPGEFSVYCNDGFSLAEKLIEKVSKMSYTEYIKENISDPLELTNTKTPMDEFSRDNLVKTYLPGSKDALPPEALAVIGAGGIFSTAEELCRFSEIFMEGSDSGLLSDKSVQAMEAPEYQNGFWPGEADTEFAYGLGWDNVNLFPFNRYDIKALTKGGDTALYHCSLVVLPEENMAMAVLSSGGASTFDKLMAEEVLLSALKAKGSIDEIKPAVKTVRPTTTAMPDSMKEYEGIYAVSGGLVKISISDDGILTLKLLLPGSSNQLFTYGGDGKFYYNDGSVYITFVDESNGNTYMKLEGYNNYPSLGQTAVSDYQAQRIADNPISDKLQSVWKKRDNKNYFIINEAYNSQIYSLNGAYTKTNIPDEIEGYFMDAAIIDANTARACVKIPGMYGRDLSDYEFFKQDGIEYLKSSGYIMIPEDALADLSAKTKFTCSIKKDGYAQWFTIGEKSAKKKIKVSLPKNSSFSVFDYSGRCVYNSILSDTKTVTLPSYGYVVFAGSPNAKFTVSYVK